ncbi:MAG: XdhC family protein [Acidobacteriota bacterium]|nr:MAG: XdhC family protein [Acidobacteriota bacterium]
MKELREILSGIDESEGPAALATVVDVQGSSYRLPGAKMLVFGDGSFVGTVSGGCVEADVLERAKRVLDTGAPEIFHYDTTGDESSVFSLNMGCKGVVRILLERVDSGSEYLGVFRKSVFDGIRGFVATKLGPGPQIERSYFDSEGRLTGGGGTDEVNGFVGSMAAEDHAARRPAAIILSGNEEYFVECASPPMHLLILGAGADAIPLADIAYRLGWRVTVADHRPAYANRDRFPYADGIIVCRPEEMAGKTRPGRETAAVVMSHNFEHDTVYLKALLDSDAGYIGALGPRVRTEEMLAKISDTGGCSLEDAPDRLHAPVGLDIGGADPETIAVSIVAEIQAAFKGRKGGFLKKREGRIYD